MSAFHSDETQRCTKSRDEDDKRTAESWMGRGEGFQLHPFRESKNKKNCKEKEEGRVESLDYFLLNSKGDPENGRS